MDKEKSVSRLFIVLLLTAAVIFVLDRTGVLGGVRRALENILVNSSEGVQSLIVDNAQEEAVRIEELLTEFEKIKKENEDLRLQLGIRSGNSTKQNLLAAHVLAHTRYFIIDKGSDDGIQSEQSVLFKNVFIGRITNVSKKTSRVLLPTDRESSIGVYTLTSSAKGIVRGQNDKMLLSQVLLSEKLDEGDTLLTVGDLDEKGRGIREGFIVGTITNIRKSDDQLYQEATVDPLLEYQDLQNVFVVI